MTLFSRNNTRKEYNRHNPHKFMPMDKLTRLYADKAITYTQTKNPSNNNVPLYGEESKTQANKEHFPHENARNCEGRDIKKKGSSTIYL